MRALLSPLFALLLLLVPVAAAQASDADLLVGTWEFQDGSGRIDVRTFSAAKDYMQTTRNGEDVILSIDGSYALDGDSLVISVDSVTPQTQEIGETISFGLIAVDTKTLVLDSDGNQLTGSRLSPAPSN